MQVYMDDKKFHTIEDLITIHSLLEKSIKYSKNLNQDIHALEQKNENLNRKIENATLIIRDGKIAYYKANGYNDLDTKAPLQKDGIFRIASQTKAITSVAIMMLFDEGKLLLTDPVSMYIPSFKKQSVLVNFNPADTTYTTVPAKREVTIKDLLTHTSGLGYAQIGSKEANAIYAKNMIALI